jgi:hypothetical protein
MNKVIEELLRVCGGDVHGGHVSWDRVLLLNNLGGVPSEHEEGDILSNRGFNLLVLDPSYAPSYFCKCRPAGTRAGVATPAARLSSVPALRKIVPPTWMVYLGPIEAEVSRYLQGHLFEATARRMTTSQLRQELGHILDAAACIVNNAGRAMPEFAGDGSPLATREMIADSVNELVNARCLPPAAASIPESLAVTEPLRRTFQHGDLWPRNVLQCPDGWRILDYESCGRVAVPLYDVCHLLRTTWDVRASASPNRSTWIDALGSSDPDAAVFRDVARHEIERVGLTPEQAGTAFVHYIMDVPARMHRRGMPDVDLAPYVREARRLSERLALGERPERLLLGAP